MARPGTVLCAGGGGGRGMVGGGAGGGKEMIGIDFRFWTRCRGLAAVDGLLDSDVVPETVEETRWLYDVKGRADDRKGAGSARICILVGRRSVLGCCVGGASCCGESGGMLRGEEG